MEDLQLKELFDAYLAGHATRLQTRQLLNHFHTADQERLRALILSSYSDRQTLPDEAGQSEAIERVKENLVAAIARQPLKKGSIRYMRIIIAAAAAVLIGIILPLIFFKNITGHSERIRQLTITTGTGERKLFTLADGSRIWLAPGSRFSYPESFSDSTRNVALQGEAFFEVAKDKAHPFIVQSGALRTRVLGTSFNIHAYGDEDKINVTLLTGKVAISVAGSPLLKTNLVPNQQADFNRRSHTLNRSDAPDAALLLARRSGSYHYSGTPVLSIIADLRRSYHLPITTIGDLSRCTFYGDFKEGDDPVLLLRKICVVINAQFKQNEEGVTIIAAGC